MECGMERRFHRGFTAAEKTELWDRWKRGESLKAIGRAEVKRTSQLPAPKSENDPQQKSLLAKFGLWCCISRPHI
jgi:hypothetical protein